MLASAVHPKGKGGFITLYGMYTFDIWPHSTDIPVTNPLTYKNLRSFLLNIKSQTNTFTISSHVHAGDWGLSRACEIIVWKAEHQIGWVWRPPICQSFHCFYGTDRAAKRKGEWNTAFKLNNIEKETKIKKQAETTWKIVTLLREKKTVPQLFL